MPFGISLSVSLSPPLSPPSLSIFKRSLRNRPPKCSKTPPLCPSHPFIPFQEAKKMQKKSKIKKRAIQHLNSDVSSREKNTCNAHHHSL